MAIVDTSLGHDAVQEHHDSMPRPDHVKRPLTHSQRPSVVNANNRKVRVRGPDFSILGDKTIYTVSASSVLR